MFNLQARWDRKLPGDESCGDGPVEVAVLFRQGRIIPVYFVLRDNRFNISRVNYRWTEEK